MQTLGPAHTADVGGTATNVRTASWTVYDDANHQTRSAQGYATQDGYGNWTVCTLVNPVSITKTDLDGRVTDQIQATRASTSGKLLPSDTFAQSSYTAWTTYQYSHTRLVSTRVYDDIPTSGVGTAGTNYDETDYGYEDLRLGLMGRLNRTETRRRHDHPRSLRRPRQRALRPGSAPTTPAPRTPIRPAATPRATTWWRCPAASTTLWAT